jgi:hypothetical protein
LEFIPSPQDLFLNLTSHAEIPGGRIKRWYWPIMENREFLGKRLTWWESAFFSKPFFVFSSSEDTVKHSNLLI